MRHMKDRDNNNKKETFKNIYHEEEHEDYELK
mgnify:CR=1 FL=1|jgi:hypothetical protein